MLKRYKEFNESSSNDGLENIKTLKDANSILKRYKNSPIWSDIIRIFNDNDIDYIDWTDLEILYFYLKYEDDLDSIPTDGILLENSKEIIDIIKNGMTDRFLSEIIKNTKNKDIEEEAKMFLSQLRTAGGTNIIKDESVNFIYINRHLIPELENELKDVKLD